MKQLYIILLLSCITCKSADNNRSIVGRKIDSPYPLNVPSNVDSPRKRSKSVVERILGDQLLPERESSPRSKEIFQIWRNTSNDPVPGVSATLCKIVRSKSVPQVDVEPPKDSSSLAQEQTIESVVS